MTDDASEWCWRLIAAFQDGYDAGFAASAEGWNGELPEDAQERETYHRRRLCVVSAFAARLNEGEHEP